MKKLHFRRLILAISLLTLASSCQSIIPSSKTAQQTQATAQQTQPQVAYGDLVINEKSDYLMIPVDISTGENQDKGLFSSYSYESRNQNFYNIIFYRKQDGASHLLLNKKALITSFDFLDNKQSGKPPTKFLLYRIIEKDTNGDKKLTSEDATIGYISDLAGKNLRQITPNNSQMLNWNVIQSMGNIFIKIIQDSDKDNKFTGKDQTTFIKVDVNNPSIGTTFINDKLEQEVKSIMAK